MKGPMKSHLLNFTLILSFALLGCQDSNSDHSSRVFRDDFYPNGELKSRVWYQNGIADSLGLWYYENGYLEVKSELSEGKEVGDVFFYYPNGRLQSYFFFNVYSMAVYKKSFDENGDFLREEGIPVYVQLDNDSTTVVKGEEFSFFVYAAKPPNTSVMIFTEKRNGEKIEETEGYRVTDRIPYYRFQFQDTGLFQIFVISELNDTLRKNIRRDTVSFNVLVNSEK
jgi:hypothetical protein